MLEKDARKFENIEPILLLFALSEADFMIISMWDGLWINIWNFLFFPTQIQRKIIGTDAF